MNRVFASFAMTAVTLASLTGCVVSTDLPPPAESVTDARHPDDSLHGTVQGAQESTEAPLHVVAVDAMGHASMSDLLDGAESRLETFGVPTALASDGRYVFASTRDGLSIIDSGMWSWAHGDHFHYYRAAPRSVGTVQGGAQATVTGSALSTAGGTGVFFRDTGKAVLLDNAELAEGRLKPIFELDAGVHNGLVAPLGDGALVTVAGDNGTSSALQFIGASGQPVPGTETECEDASGSAVTPAGLVIGCAGGALVATVDEASGGAPHYQRIAYPKGTKAEDRAERFDGRKGRTSVAAVAGDHGAWVLDVREGTWRRILADVPLLKVSAVDDKEGHVVAVDTSGRIHVQKLNGNDRPDVSKPLLAETLEDQESLAGVQLVTDQQRAYVNDPAAGTVYEIAFADGARIARKIDTAAKPVFMAVTGR